MTDTPDRALPDLLDCPSTDFQKEEFTAGSYNHLAAITAAEGNVPAFRMCPLTHHFLTGAADQPY